MGTKRKKVTQGHGFGSMRDLDETPGVAPGLFQRGGATPSYSASRDMTTGGGSQSTGVMPTAIRTRSSSNTAPGTFGSRVAPSPGNSIGSGTVRGEMPSVTTASSSAPVKSATPRPGQPVVTNRLNAAQLMNRANHTGELGGVLKTNHGMGRSNCKF